MKMTVIDTNNELYTIDLMEVDFIETDNRRIVYHIRDKKYYQIMHKSELDYGLADHGFISLDRPNLVNLTKIRSFDNEFGKVYFTSEPALDSSYVTVAKMKYKYVSEIVNLFDPKFTPDKEVSKGVNFKSVIKEMLHL